MELQDLENIWRQHTNKSAENINLNKDLLKQMLLQKSRNRLKRITVKAGINFILPIIILLLFVPKFRFRAEVDFYASILFFGIFCILTCYWRFMYFTFIRKIDLNNPVTLVKKELYNFERYKIKTNKLSFVLMPFAITSIFLIAEIPIFSKGLLPFSFLMLFLLISIFYTFKHYMSENYKTLLEINEIEKLEKEGFT
jgi:hypothetical protein